jgi:ubiquinone/menaquinone biosynthesis C-methylase UbiE
MEKNNLKVSDYEDYDYELEFWQAEDRRYEDACEKRTVKRLLSKVPDPIETIIDSGCGFGRLFEAYEHRGSKHILMDYSENMISQAKKRLGNHESCTFIQGNLYDIPLDDACADVFISVRTLHHLPDLLQYCTEVHRVIKPGGYLIAEIPNKRHLLNIIKWVIGKSKARPFSHEPLVYSETFVNFHPEMAIKLFKRNGFHVKLVANTNFFRSPFIKAHIPVSLLKWSDGLMQSLFSLLNLAPSIFVLFQRES